MFVCVQLRNAGVDKNPALYETVITFKDTNETPQRLHENLQSVQQKCVVYVPIVFLCVFVCMFSPCLSMGPITPAGC